MNARAYKSATSKMFWGVVGNTIFHIVSIVLRIVAFVSIVAAAASGTFPWWLIAIVALMEVFYIVILVGLSDLVKLFQGSTRKALKQFRAGIILEMVADVLLIIPFVGHWIGCLLSVIWAIIYIVAFGTLKQASDFPGRDGAQFLQLSMIAAIIAFVLQFIPLLGTIGAVVEIVYTICLVIGWWKLKNAPVSDSTYRSSSYDDEDGFPSRSYGSTSSSGYHTDDF